jgi:hypothetical protein
MTVAGTIAYKFLAHVYTLIGMPVSATQVDSTTFDLLACNLRDHAGGYETGMCLENIGMQGRKNHASVTCKCYHIVLVTFTCR